jgi:DNA topoisomerase-3
MEFIKSELVRRDKKHLLPTEKGISLIKILPDSVKSPLLTAEWENHLCRIERGELSASDFMNSIGSYVADTVRTYNCVPDEHKSLFPNAGRGQAGEVIGKCSRCGGDVVENNKAFSCNQKCGFALFKDSKFFTAKKKKLTKDIAKTLLAEGRVFMSGLHSGKTGKTYSATIILDDKGGGFPGFRMEFEKK